MLASAALVATASCGSDKPTRTAEPATTRITTTLPVATTTGGVTSDKLEETTTPLARSLDMKQGEAVRFVVNALRAVDLVGYIGVDSADIDKFDDAFQPGAANELRANSDAYDLDERYGDVPKKHVLLFRASADGWDDVLTPEKALPDAANVPSGPSFYEIRLAWVAPVAGRYWFYALSDDDPTKVQFRLETAFNQSAVASSDDRGIFSPENLPTLFPMYASFFGDYTSDANEQIDD